MVIVTDNPKPDPQSHQMSGSSQNNDATRNYLKQLRMDKMAKDKEKYGKFPMLRKLAIIQSLILILFAALGILGIFVNYKDAVDRWIGFVVLSVAVAGQILNITVHWIDPSYQTTTWLGLVLMRKKLEEKRKIEELSNKK